VDKYAKAVQSFNRTVKALAGDSCESPFLYQLKDQYSQCKHAYNSISSSFIPVDTLCQIAGSLFSSVEGKLLHQPPIIPPQKSIEEKLKDSIDKTSEEFNSPVSEKSRDI
jgi:hypothetical protein